MKRRIGTAVSVVCLLAVGTAAAAVNVRLLDGSGAGATLASFEAQAPGGADPWRSAAGAIGAPLPLDAVAASPASGATTVDTTDADVRTIGPVDSADDDHPMGPEAGRPPMGGDPANRPPLTEAQLALLRVAAMVRLNPGLVHDVAKGEVTDDALLAAVKRAAEAVGTTIAQLADVELPERHDRGHGGDGRMGHDGPPATSGTYDD